jgi:hypothetical protein
VTRSPLLLRCIGVGLLAGAWLALGSSCVLAELTTANLCGRFTYLDDGCAACSAEACCDEERACRESAVCTALNDCIAACGLDASCIVDCSLEHGNDDAATALTFCQGLSCAPQCSACGLSFEGSPSECGACLRNTCCQEQLDCADSPGCIDLIRCVTACDFPGCETACLGNAIEDDESFETTSQLYLDAIRCGVVGCQADCQFGTNWGCVGDFDFPLSGTNEVNFEATFVDLLGNRVADLAVDACNALEPDCADPIVSGVTDEDGKLSLTIPASGTGFDGFFAASKPGFVASRYYAAVPLRTSVQQRLTTATEAQAQSSAALAGTTIDPSRGQLIVTMVDCLGQLGIGVQFDIGDAADAESAEFYFSAGLPSANHNATTGDGIGGWVNAIPGAVAVVGKLQEGGATVAGQVVELRPNTVTFLLHAPQSR